MIRRFRFAVWLCPATLAFLLPTVAGATSSRALSLRDSFLIDDDTDVFRFPAQVDNYGDLIVVDYTPSTSTGNAGVVLGDRIKLGVFLNRDYAFDDIEQLQLIYGVGDPAMRKLVDLFAAMSIGSGHSLGWQLSPGYGISTTDIDPVGPEGFQSTGSRAFVLETGPGWSYSSSTYSGDATLLFSINSFKQSLGGDVLYEGGGASILLRQRSIWGDEQRALGFEALLTRRAYGLDQPGTNGEGRYSRWIAAVDAGPRLGLHERVTLALAMRLSLEWVGGTVDDEDQLSVLGFGFPGAVGALEVRLTDRWRARSGADYVYRTEIENDPVDVGNVSHARRIVTVSEFSWSVGLGYERAGFSVDGLLSSALLLDGPNFVGGTSPSLFGGLSAKYDWSE